MLFVSQAPKNDGCFQGINSRNPIPSCVNISISFNNFSWPVLLVLCVSQGERDPLFWSLSRHGSNSYKLRKLIPREDEWEIPSSCLMRESELGEGAFGKVHKGFVRGPIEWSKLLKSAVCTTVAIKYLKCKHLPSLLGVILFQNHSVLFNSQGRFERKERFCEWDS